MNDLPVFGLQQDSDGIYGLAPENIAQKGEVVFRESIANFPTNVDILREVGQHHSIQVMDREVRRFTHRLPLNARIVDVGGCWGWHWRNLFQYRPDIQVFIVDFVRSNLLHAKAILEPQIGNSVFLVHGDALALEFPADSFDGYWSVQTLQHIPNINGVLKEARRVLKVGGQFASYSLNVQPIIRMLSQLAGKPYITEGQFGEHLFLRRANKADAGAISACFNAPVSRRYSEFLFQPNLRTTFTGREHSVIGTLDSLLSSSNSLLGSFARQQSFHCVAGAKTPITILDID
ncbi:MAG: class I SAM-dependent methyltransferase [Ilumatobacteraceae bacterium]